MTKTIFIVQERHYEYDDERYYFPENGDDSGSLVRAFQTQEKAKEVCRKKNIEWVRGIDRLGDYYEEGFKDVLGQCTEQQIELLKKHLKFEEDDYMEMPSNLPDDVLELLVDVLDICPFIICQVELDE